MSKITNGGLTWSGWHMMPHSCGHVATAGVKGLRLCPFINLNVFIRYYTKIIVTN